MFTIRRGPERGHFDHGWLNTYHTFSFSEYYDPQWMNFRNLRVMNEDVVAPGQGFGMHGHRDMEIITYVLSGQLQHRDSLGSGEILTPGELQYMSAGTGIRHSEFNPSETEPVHLYQIWIMPDRVGYEPRYQQTRFDPAEMQSRFRVVASPEGRDGAIPIRQDAVIAIARLSPGQTVDYPLDKERYAWLQVLRGKVEVGEAQLSAGDGVAISQQLGLQAVAQSDAEVMLFDLV